MKVFMENLVSRLEELPTIAINRYKGGAFGNYVGTNHYIDKRKTIDAINELAEEFATDTNVGNKTNADRIRNMTDEELAEFLCKVKADYQWTTQDFPREDECGEWEIWLQSESEG